MARGIGMCGKVCCDVLIVFPMPCLVGSGLGRDFNSCPKAVILSIKR